MAGRPTKLTQKVIDILKQIVDEYIYCTDEEILFMLNEKLPENERIAKRTFQAYKDGDRQENNPLMSEFVHYIKKALIKQKIQLLKKVEKGEQGWQSKSWILERKWDEWNLKGKQEIKQENIHQFTGDPFEQIRINSGIKDE